MSSSVVTLSFQDYFSDCTESVIKENYVIVYEVRLYTVLIEW